MAQPWEDFGAPSGQTPQTSAPSWENFGGPQSDPLAGATESFHPNAQVPQQAVTPKDVYGIDPATKAFIQGGEPGFGPRGVLANAIDYGVVPFQFAGNVIEKGANLADQLAVKSGLADLPTTLGLDKYWGTKDQILPGAAMMAGLEAFPLGGAEAGLVNPSHLGGSHPVDFLPPEVRGHLEDLYAHGTPSEILDYAHKNGATIDEAQLQNWTKYRDEQKAKGQAVNTQPGYASAVPEANAWDNFGVDQGHLDNVPEKTTFSNHLEKEGPKTFAEKPPEETAPNPSVDSVVNYSNDVTKGWKNSPSIEVHPDFSKVEADPQALGVYDADTGKIMLNADAIHNEADFRNIPPRAMTNAVIFHESLGHYGLAQVFRDDLDGTINSLYDTSTFFKKATDNWLEQNPNDYVDSPDRLARAGEEVLAQMSEKGPLPTSFVDKVKDTVKTYARKMGIKLDVSEREVKGILAQAHSKVINGEASDLSGTGTRNMYAGIQSRIASWPESTGNGDWFTGPDNIDRFEINDQNSRFNDQAFNHLVDTTKEEGKGHYVLKLGDVLDHPDLYKAYPKLKNYEVGVLGPREGYGVFNEKTKTIKIAADVLDKRSTALHEIQHAIQGIEDMARGGAPERAFDYMSTSHLKETLSNVLRWDKKLLDKQSKELELLDEARHTPEFQAYSDAYHQWVHDASISRDLADKLGEDHPFVKEARDETLKSSEISSKAEAAFRKAIGIDKPYSEMSAKERAAYSKFDEIAITPEFFDEHLKEFGDAFTKYDEAMKALSGGRGDVVNSLKTIRHWADVEHQAYQSLFGEVEARDVQARANLSDAERAQTAPYSSQNEVSPPSSYVIHRWQRVSKEVPQQIKPEAVKEEDPAVKATAELLGIPSESIPKALTEQDFLHQVMLTKRELANGDLKIDPIFGPTYTKKGLVKDTVRYMKSTYGSGSKGPLRGPGATEEGIGTGPVNKYRTERPVEDILKEATPESVPQTHEEWMTEAAKIKMTGKTASTLATGATPPELLAAQEFALKSANRIYDLSKKASQGLASERELHLLGKEMERLDDVSRSIMDAVSNAARILNSRNITVATDKALTDNIRRMLSKADLSTPEGIQAAASELVKDQKKAQRLEKSLNILGNVLNLPRTVMSSFDLSAPFRQGLFFVSKKQFWNNIPGMFKQFWNEDFHQQMMNEIKSRPNYPLMKKGNLSLTEFGKNLTEREEQFVSQWAEKLPVIGRGIRASDRAYTGFLNKLRADTFDSFVDQYNKAGIDLSGDSKALGDIASFVNNATGRGSLGKYSQAGPLLNSIFFSPRLIASRVQLLNPAYYLKLDPIIRKEAIKSAMALGGIALTVTGLASMIPGVTVEKDPRSSDFAKIKSGNTRYDILGGFGQYITLGARLATNEKKNSIGKIDELGAKFGSPTRLDVALNFLINKESPVASFVTDYLRGKDGAGQPFSVRKEVASRFIPLFLQDASDVIQEKGAAKGAAMATPGIFGVGIQTYSQPLRYDQYGISNQIDRKADPVAQEVDRLEGTQKGDIANRPSKSLGTTDAGDKVTLNDQAYLKYEKQAGDYFHLGMTYLMNMKEWKTLSDHDKIVVVKEILKESRSEAKQNLNLTKDDVVVENK